jgi:SAM-dependent methyltransferase
MSEPAPGPIPFFDEYPRFLETSKTGHTSDRLNARYTGLIHRNRDRLAGATVLDLASHDGRFSFAALQAGAARVVGVEVDGVLVEAANENFAQYRVADDRYEFIERDMFRHFDDLERFDVVLCFGILYHVNDHMQLLTNIAGVEPTWIIVDTKISQLDLAVIELRSAVGVSPPPPGSHLEGYPSRLALDAMLSSLGWESEYFDWAGSGLIDSPTMDDYLEGRRVTVVSRGNERVSPEDRAYAVGLVQALQQERRTQWMTIKGVAAKCDVNPYALRTWVLRAEGERGADA